MPVHRMKKVWKYCTYNVPFFILILILFGIPNHFFTELSDSHRLLLVILGFIVNSLILGYGMTITRDRINDGIRLPKIMIKDVLVLGIKSSIVTFIYFYIQGYVLDFVSSPLDFPVFELEDMLLELPETIHMLFSHNPFDTLFFVVVGAILFYATTFFMEIALARLADTGSIISAFNLLEIKKDIDIAGWKHYAKDYTFMIVAIVLFLSLEYIVFPINILNIVFNILLELLAFVTQFMGIGAIYAEIKAKKSE